MKSREEVEKLKSDWKSDPCWDIETTEGFEDYADELFQFSEKCNQEWKQKAQERQEADPLYQAKKKLQWCKDNPNDIINTESNIAIGFALVAIAEELRRANDNQELEWERQETRELYQ